MEQFIDYVLQFGNLNKQQIDLITSKATEIELRKDEFYWEAGKTVKQIGFRTVFFVFIITTTKAKKLHATLLRKTI